MTLTVTPLAVSTGTAAAMCGMSRSAFYSAWSGGRTPEGIPVGRRRIFPVKDIALWVEAGCPSREKFEQIKNANNQRQ